MMNDVLSLSVTLIIFQRDTLLCERLCSSTRDLLADLLSLCSGTIEGVEYFLSGVEAGNVLLGPGQIQTNN